VTKAEFIAAQRTVHGIPHATSCRALGVSQAWFYKWLGGDRSPRRARRAALDATVLYWFRLRAGRCGSPMIHADLVEAGWKVSVNTVAASMREQGLVARPKRKRRGTTRAERNARKAPDALKRDFDPPDLPDQRWVGDLTEIPTSQGKFYLAVILDLHSRRCVGFAMSAHHDAALATAALQVAIAVRGGDVKGVIFHSDQGGEFTGNVFKAACLRAGVTQSMGRTGSALDNAVAESFNSTLEFEVLSQQAFTTRQQARRTVAAWIDGYNNDRRHSTVGRVSPVLHEQRRRTA
jgi:putative transposase